MNIDIKDFMDIKIFDDKIHRLRKYISYCVLEAPNKGLILEFGVFEGRSINFISENVPNRKIYGFDSFEGLPEDWIKTKTFTHKATEFATSIPEVSSNVTLIKGLFQDILKEWYAVNNEVIAFLHIDSDLYSSAIYILNTLNDGICPGTIIAFDELCDWSASRTYDTWREHEWKALVEWTEQHNRVFEPIARTDACQAAIRIIK